MRAALIVLLLSGCAGLTTTAKVPVPVSCVQEAPVKPLTASESDILAMTDYAATLTAWTERLTLKAYAEKAEVVIQACK